MARRIGRTSILQGLLKKWIGHQAGRAVRLYESTDQRSFCSLPASGSLHAKGGFEYTPSTRSSPCLAEKNLHYSALPWSIYYVSRSKKYPPGRSSAGLVRQHFLCTGKADCAQWGAAAQRPRAWRLAPGSGPWLCCGPWRTYADKTRLWNVNGLRALRPSRSGSGSARTDAQIVALRKPRPTRNSSRKNWPAPRAGRPIGPQAM